MSDEPRMTKPELLQKMEQGYNNFVDYIKSLTPEQLTGPTDAAGWTAKDHVAHLAVWEDGVAAPLEGQNRRERMGVDEADWERDDYDAMNAVIQQRYKDRSLDQVMQMFDESHRRLVAAVQAHSEDELNGPYRNFDPDSDSDHPIGGSVIGNSYGHYEEHRPWIDAIVRQA